VAEGSEVVEVDEEVRRVSERPGAEGAPRSVALVVEVGCDAGGAMRRDCLREGRVRWAALWGRSGGGVRKGVYHFDGTVW
jgi:hypothetical protein